MPNYNGYRQSNSTEIPRYVGSAVPEMSVAAQMLQQRYDQSRNYEDMLDQGINSSTSTPQDTQLLEGLKNEYRGKIKERAGKGDYENMVRETARDAREFVTKYQPIATNQKAVQDYYTDLQDKVEKKFISKDTADALYNMSVSSYKGLQKDPVTGQYTNHFRGTSAAEDIDMSKWVDEALKGLNPQTLGSTVRKINGDFYEEVGGRTVKLNMDRIWPALQAAMGSDPKFQSFARQHAMLSSYPARNLSEDTVAKHPELYNQIKQIQQANGISFQDAAQQYYGATAGNDLMKQAYTMGAKYIRDDRESSYKNMGMTEVAQHDLADKEKDIFGGMIPLNLPGSKMDTPDKIMQGSTDLQTAMQKASNDTAALLRNLKQVTGTRPDGTKYEKYMDADGVEQTDKVEANRLTVAQLAMQKAAVEERAARLQKAVGLTPKEVALMQSLDKQEDWSPAALTEIPGIKTMGILHKIGDKLSALGDKLNPQSTRNLILSATGLDQKWRNYEQAVKEDSKNSTVESGLFQFNSIAANKSMNKVFTDLVLNLDKDGIKAGAVGLQHMNGDKLESDDYKKVQGESSFAGWALDPGSNKIKLVFKAGHMGESKGELKGEQGLYMMDAPPQVYEYLRKSGQSEATHLVLSQAIGSLENYENKKVTLPFHDGTVTVSRRTPYDQENPDPRVVGNQNPQYVMTFEFPDGKRELLAQDKDEVIAKIIGNHNIIEKAKK